MGAAAVAASRRPEGQPVGAGVGRGDDGAHDVTAVDHVKLLRNLPDLRFEGRIHEQILPAIRRLGGEVAWTDLFVVHSGSDHSPEGRARKLDRDFRLLELEHTERPDHPFTLFNLGMTCVDCDRFEEAERYLRRSIAQAGPGESHLRKAQALLAYALMRLGRRRDALTALDEALVTFPEDAELRFRLGVLLHEAGRLEDAARAYRDVLEQHEERHFSSLDRGITGFKCRQNLAVVLADLGDHDAAEQQWRRVVAEVPRYRLGWRGLGELLLRRGRLDDVRTLIASLADDDALRSEAALLAARVAVAVGEPEHARAAFEDAVAARPDDPEVLHYRCQFLFEHGTDDEAEHALCALIAREPGDAAAHHNLGTLLLRAGRAPEAAASYEAALAHRPDHPPTLLQLGHARAASGRRREAEHAWGKALRLDPANREAREALERLGPAPVPR